MAKKKADTEDNVIKGKSIFDHLAGITHKKVKWSELSDMDKKSFSPFIINRWLSMNMDYIELINELQTYTIGILSPRDTYKVYYEYLPDKKTFDKYVKGKSDNTYNPELISYLIKWFKVSSREIYDYLELMDKSELENILKKYGLEEKKIKELIKRKK
jgi:hypothetical protein